jgi:hypothetical protein
MHARSRALATGPVVASTVLEKTEVEDEQVSESQFVGRSNRRDRRLRDFWP